MIVRDDDFALEQVIGRVLQIGLVAAASTVAVGGILMLLRAGPAAPDVGRFSDVTSSYRSVSAIAVGVSHAEGGALVMLGILLLIATPVIRVAFMLFAFAARGDRLYVLLSAVVLAILFAGLLG